MAIWRGTALCHQVMTVHAVVEDIAAEAVATIMADVAGAEVVMAVVKVMVVAAAAIEVVVRVMFVTIVVNLATFPRTVQILVLEVAVAAAVLVMDKVILAAAIPAAKVVIWRGSVPNNLLIDAVAHEDHPNVTTAKKSGIWRVNARRAILEVAMIDGIECYPLSLLSL